MPGPMKQQKKKQLAFARKMNIGKLRIGDSLYEVTRLLLFLVTVEELSTFGEQFKMLKIQHVFAGDRKRD